MKTISTVALLFVIPTAFAQTIYPVAPNTKGNQIELSIANGSSMQQAEMVEVTVLRHPAAIAFTSQTQTVNTIAPNHDASATFMFDVGRPIGANKKDTIEFQVRDKHGSTWKKLILVSFALPEEFKLEQNYPNPFNPSTTIRYQLPTESTVLIKVYDILGREVVSLVHEQQPAGFKETQFNAVNFASGVYFYRLEARPLNGASAFSQLRKLMVVK